MAFIGAFTAILVRAAGINGSSGSLSNDSNTTSATTFT